MNGLRGVLSGLCDTNQVNSVELLPLPYRKIKLFRRHAVSRLASCLKDPNAAPDVLSGALKSLNYELDASQLPDRLYLNGEGDIHSRSGHLARLLGIASLHKRLGACVCAVNQSVDLVPGSEAASLVKMTYPTFDYISVREPCSLRLLNQLGLDKVELVPDAAFSLPPVTDEEVAVAAFELQLPAQYVCLTGSSDLNARSAGKFLPVYESVRQVTGLPVVMLASTKTDKALGKLLHDRNPEVRVITDTVDYRSVMAVIAGSQMLVGGRFHLAIFAALQGTPVVPFEGNTHKIKGLVELLAYPVGSIDWKEQELYPAQIRYVFENWTALGESLRVRSHYLAKQVRRLAAPELPG